MLRLFFWCAIFSVPGVLEAGWTEEELKAQSRRKSDRDTNTTNKELIALWREIEKNDNAWPFRDPVDLQEVADYTKVVAHPMGEPFCSFCLLSCFSAGSLCSAFFWSFCHIDGCVYSLGLMGE